MASGSNDQRSQHHCKYNQDLRQLEDVVELRHQKEKKCGQKRLTKKNESGEAAPVIAALQSSIRRSKSQMWSDHLQNLRGAEVWRETQYANNRGAIIVEALMDREGNEANTATEKGLLRKPESFPLNDDDHHAERQPSGRAQTRITNPEVERALYPQSVKRAPGPDKLFCSTIEQLWK